MLLEDLKAKIATGLKISQPVFSYPPNPQLGDLSLACFSLAKKAQRNPGELAIELAKTFDNNLKTKKYFSNIQAVGPYVNFFIRPEYLASRLIPKIQREKNNYGRSADGYGHKVMIEYSNGNTHKEYHVGHLRNIAYGDAICKLLAASGYQTIPVSYINDFGIHVAKTIWQWQKETSYQTRTDDKGYLLGQCYAAASQALEKNPAEKPAVIAIMKEIESRTGANYQLWQETRRWSIDYFATIYKELEIKFQNIFYESEVITAGLKIVQDLIHREILEKSEGAIIANLEKYDLGVLPIIRSDGTALYPVADLALASEKFCKYPLDISIYVVDVRQSLYFKQLFKILELMGYHQKMQHLPYDFVTLPEGMMSSRTGQVITYEELKNKLRANLLAETKKRHQDWTINRLEQVAQHLTISTIKFEMLKVSVDKIITFNLEEAVKFEGYTACYLQYGYVRLKSIVRKEGFYFSLRRPNFSCLTENREKELLLKLAKYPEIIKSATEKYNPSELTKYLFELVQLANDYYHATNILKAPLPLRRARLALIKAITQVLYNGFNILGMPVLEEM